MAWEQHKFVSQVLEAGKSVIELLAALVSGVHFLSLLAESSHGRRSRGALWGPFHSTPNPFMRTEQGVGSPARGPTSKHHHMEGVTISTSEFYGDTHIQSIAILEVFNIIRVYNSKILLRRRVGQKSGDHIFPAQNWDS